MKDQDNAVFVSVFKEACVKCFGHSLTAPLSETESKLLCKRILEQTGLVMDVQRVRNYSLYILNGAGGKKEDPSVVTLDTLARYVLDAPHTDEIERKNNEDHYPYWFEYKSNFSRPARGGQATSGNWKIVVTMLFSLIGISSVVFLLFRQAQATRDEKFTDNFNSVREDSLADKGWFVKSKDATWWNRRGERPGYLQLFTLRGDNWPDAANAPGIKNLLVRKISGDCFTAEIHLDNFIPRQNWQQTGILLLEDTTDTSKAIRLSIAFNEGHERPAEIIIQASSSSQRGGLNNPEEIAHVPVVTIQSPLEDQVKNNLKNSALRIEKTGNHFRFSFSTSFTEDVAFKEAGSRDLTIQPKYIGIFASEGFANNSEYIPVNIDFFSFDTIPCSQ